MSIKIIAVIAILGMSGQVSAGFSANNLLTDCKSPMSGHQNFCEGFLLAAAETHNTYAHFGYLKKMFCIPKGTVTIGQLKRVFVRYANIHPGELHLTASSIVMKAFKQAFSC